MLALFGFAGCAGASHGPSTHVGKSHADAGTVDSGRSGARETDDDAGTDVDATLAAARGARLESYTSALRPLAQARCEWLGRCCKTNELAAKLGPSVISVDECTYHMLQVATSASSSTTTGRLSNDLPVALRFLLNASYGPAADLVKLDEDAVARCQSQLQSAACSSPLPLDHCLPRPITEDACALGAVFVGLGKAGDDCVFVEYGTALGCGPGTRCVGAERLGYPDRGYCVATRQLDDGCATDDDCDAELVCDYQTARCVKGGGEGTACAFADPAHPSDGTETARCARGLACDFMTLRCADAGCRAGSFCYVGAPSAACPQGLSCVANHCMPLRAPGEECITHDACANHLCLAGTKSSDPARCAGFAKAGDDCTWDPECESGFCSPSLKCAPTVPAGSPCPARQDSQCASGECDRTTLMCTTEGGPGASCASSNDCATWFQLSCVSGKCRHFNLGLGDSCDSDIDGQCSSGWCSAGQCRIVAPAGTQCGTSADRPPCDLDHYCDNVRNPGLPGACRAKKGAGEPCTDSYECSGNCTAVFGSKRCESARTMCVGPAKNP